MNARRNIPSWTGSKILRQGGGGKAPQKTYKRPKEEKGRQGARIHARRMDGSRCFYNANPSAGGQKISIGTEGIHQHQEEESSTSKTQGGKCRKENPRQYEKDQGVHREVHQKNSVSLIKRRIDV